MNPRISLRETQGISQWIIDIRRRIHARPELSYSEYETAQLIAEKLKECGIETWRGVYNTGVVALLKGAGDGPTVALRADIDALPVKETNTFSYKSTLDNRMHACGHDGHTAMLLGAARLLSSIRNTLNGNVKFIFQPAEEVPPEGGAKGMVEAGVLENPQADAIFGLHIWPDLPTGSVGVKSGALMAAPDRFRLAISGKGGHGAAPHQAADTVVTAAQVILALQTIPSRHIDPLLPVVLSVCQISGGSAYNILPDEVVLEGATRYFAPNMGQQIEKLMGEIVGGICQANACSFTLDYQYGYPPTINDKQMATFAARSAAELLGDDRVVQIINPSMTGEDFSVYLQKVPGCFIWLGTRNVDKGIIYPLHSSLFQIDEDVLSLGAALLANLALDYCNQHS